MFRFLLSGVICLILWTNASELVAQSGDKELAEAIHVVNNSSDRSLVHAAIIHLEESQREGNDITAAIPGMRKLVIQNVNLKKPRGVYGDGDRALLCLMRCGDPQAISHYLSAQTLHFRRTGDPMDLGDQYENAYLMAIDEDHFPQTLALLTSFLPAHRTAFYSRNGDDYPLLLVWLARFSEDKTALIKEVNDAWKEHLARRDLRVSSGKDFTWFVPVVSSLADQPGLLPSLISDIDSHPPTVKELYGVLLATVAPFRKDALATLQKWLDEQRDAGPVECWIAAYVDSAYRLSDDKRALAYAELTKIAKSKYDQVKPIHPLFFHLTLLNQKPFFTASEKALVDETARAFGEGEFLDPERYKTELDLDSGLGTSF